MTSFSAVVITFNEEHNIRDCLDSISFADEIIVVDSGSADTTVSIAKEYTDKVFVIEWKGYAASKNFGIDQAEHDWILSLDADERVTDRLRDSIQNRSTDNYPGYTVSRRTWYMGRWIKGGGWYPDRKIRLFNRLKGRFQTVSVHENVEIEGKTGHLEGDILHYSYQDISDHVQRIDKYSSLISDNWLEKGRAVTPCRMVCRTFWEFIRSYVFRKGYKDGAPGIVLAGMHAFYTFLKYSKTIEQQIDTKDEQ